MKLRPELFINKSKEEIKKMIKLNNKKNKKKLNKGRKK